MNTELIQEPEIICWWNLDQLNLEDYDINWNNLWEVIQDDPYPPQSVLLESVLFVYEQLTLHLDMNIIFANYFNERYYFRDCPASFCQRIALL
jgi:hypothetical protein